MTTTSPTPNPEIRGPFSCTVPRTIKASPERVFRAWTEAERARPWLSNGGDLILQPHKGGLFFLDMIYGGHTYPHYGRYLQVETNRLLEFTWVSQSTLGKETIVRVDFEADGSGTKVTLTHKGLPDEKNKTDHEGGWTEILQWLEERIGT
jgi:uncharacterized protein YndB with AHSA1/START domain